MEPKEPTERWYATRNPVTNEFKVTKTDSDGAVKLYYSGWELGEHAFDREEDAERYLQEWKDRLKRFGKW